MTVRLIIRSLAERDLAEARDWYESQREGLGIEFLTAVEDRLSHIVEFPEAYAVEYRGVRPAGVRRFPYVVYYRLIDKGAEVLAVLHASRQPRVWRSRSG